MAKQYTSQQLDDMKDSELLRIAVADTQKVEADPDYVLDMSDWLIQLSGGPCEVCMAGAIIANRFPGLVENYNPRLDWGGREVVKTTGILPNWAFRVNRLRTGESLDAPLAHAFKALAKEYGEGSNGWTYPPEMYLEFADILEDVGR